MRSLICTCAVLVCLAGTAGADQVGFSVAEGYAAGNLAGQPSSGATWMTTNHVYENFQVSTNWTGLHTDLCYINLSGEHGPSSELTTAEYATRRMVPVTGTFAAGYSFKLNGQGLVVDQTVIALGQQSNALWGPYLGVNKINATSLNYHNGTGWSELIGSLDTGEWYNVEIVGSVDTGTFDLVLYEEELRDPGDATAGRLLQVADLAFRDNPTELAYVMMSNEGSGKDTGTYYQLYDDLYLVPEPATMSLLGLGLAALAVRRRRK